MMKVLIILLCTITLICARDHFGRKYYIEDIFDHKAAELANHLRTKSLDQLRNYCLILESWTRSEKGITTRSVIREFIWRLDTEFLISYIISMGYLNKQILDKDYFIKNIAYQYEADIAKIFLGLEEDKSENENINSESESVRMLTKMGGLHDFIFFQPKETLEKWALTCEAHHRSVNELQLIGGIEDYITTLSHQELVEYILKEAEEHFELNSAEGLDSLAKTYGIEH